MTQLYFSSAACLRVVTDPCSQMCATLFCEVTNKLLPEMVTVSRSSQLRCWSEPVANLPVVGAAFSLLLLVSRSVVHAVAGEVVTGKEPVSAGGSVGGNSFVSE